MQKLFSQKRVEMRKKLLAESESERTSAYNNRRKQLASASVAREQSKQSVASKMLANKSSPRSGKGNGVQHTKKVNSYTKNITR
jgi:hypothetical protein